MPIHGPTCPFTAPNQKTRPGDCKGWRATQVCYLSFPNFLSQYILTASRICIQTCKYICKLLRKVDLQQTNKKTHRNRFVPHFVLNRFLVFRFRTNWDLIFITIIRQFQVEVYILVQYWHPRQIRWQSVLQVCGDCNWFGPCFFCQPCLCVFAIWLAS